jgi:hypothetical protein
LWCVFAATTQICPNKTHGENVTAIVLVVLTEHRVKTGVLIVCLAMRVDECSATRAYAGLSLDDESQGRKSCLPPI